MSAEIFAVTIAQPWAWATAAGHRPVENRTWCPAMDLLGKMILICANSEIDTASINTVGELTGADDDWLDPFEGTALITDAIVGCARLTGVVSHSTLIYSKMVHRRRDELLSSPWFRGPIAWVFENAVEFTTPIPCRAEQWVWPVDQQVAARCREEWKKIVGAQKKAKN